MTLSKQQVASPTVAELDYGLRSKFLANLDDEQKLRIFDLTTRASRELHRWAARFPLIRRVRVWPLSLSVTAAAPFASASSLVTMARMSLWVFTIDDLFDEETVPFAELKRRVERYKSILRGESSAQKRERDTLVLALQDVRDDLSQYKLFPLLQEEWAEAVSRTLDAMMREHEWRMMYSKGGDGAKLPSYDLYLKHGSYSIGVAAHIWTALIAIGDESTLNHLPRLKAMERRASLSIRLANDLQSYHKELAEGKINSVIIRQREAISRGLSDEQALTWACDTMGQEIREGLASCTELQRQAQTATGEPERAILDIARFVCDFYVHHDYHTFTTAPGRAS
jgi:hypothetical protein